MARVLAHPPGVTDSDDEVGHDSTEELVELARLEHLAVRELVGDERVLSEQDAHGAGDEQRVPGALKQREAEPGAHHGERDHGEGRDVEGSAAAQQAGIANRIQQGRILVEGIADAAGAGLDDADGFASYSRSHVASVSR